MTTSYTNTVVDYSSDAGFRTWGAEFHAQLVVIGLTLSSDTGQINWTTVVKPAINTSAGYEIWQFNDSLQSTAPIFIKLEFGGGNTTNYLQIWITAGQGTNGTGTLTGVTSVRTCAAGAYNGNAAGGSPITSTVTLYPSRFIYSATLGFFGFAWKAGAGTSAVDMPLAAAFVYRSTNSSGAATPTTINLLAAGNGTTTYGILQCLNYTTSTNYPVVTGNGSWYGSHAFASTSTTDGTNLRIDPIFFLTPSVNIAVGVGRALKTEVPIGTSVSATLVGPTAHTYIQIGCPWITSTGPTTSYAGQDLVFQSINGTLMGFVMLWE